MIYKRMPIEKESPEELGYGSIRCNLAESSVSDYLLKDIQLNIGDLTLCYTDHRGMPALRKLIVGEYKNLKADHVLLTVGAASALFIIASSLLTANDHLIVVRPNYATNLETPKTIGCNITYIDLSFENEWQPELSGIASAIRTNTRYISITHPHNPTGTLVKKETLETIIRLAEEKNIYVLVDETYRDLSFETLYPIAASLSPNVISVSSVSKAYGLPGLRLGWLITQNEKLLETFLAAKEQIFITNSVIDEEIAFQFLLKKEIYQKEIKQQINTNFSILEQWINNEQRLEWVRPGGGVVCFPRIKSPGNFNVQLFHEILLNKYGTLVGPGHWFEMPDQYMRIGYAWPKTKELTEGLLSISKALDEAQIK